MTGTSLEREPTQRRVESWVHGLVFAASACTPSAQTPENAPPPEPFIAGPSSPGEAAELRAALLRANARAGLAELVDVERGLAFARVEDDRVAIGRTLCFDEHLARTELGPRLDGAWTCDEGSVRCVARREWDASEFRWRPDKGGAKRLYAIVDYTDPAAVDLDAASGMTPIEPTGCQLWRALLRRDSRLIPGELTVLRNPYHQLGDPVPSYRHLCGDAARQAALENMAPNLDVTMQYRCEGLTCSVDVEHSATQVFVFRRGEDGEPRLWIAGDDFAGEDEADPDAGSMLEEAMRRAERNRCSNVGLYSGAIFVPDWAHPTPTASEAAAPPPLPALSRAQCQVERAALDASLQAQNSCTADADCVYGFIAPSFAPCGAATGAGPLLESLSERALRYRLQCNPPLKRAKCRAVVATRCEAERCNAVYFNSR